MTEAAEYSLGLAVAGVLAFAATAKAAGYGGWRTSLAQSGVPFPTVAAATIPVAELVAAVSLALRPRAGSWVAIGLLVPMTLHLLRMATAPVRRPCNCFGPSSRPVDGIDLLRNAALMAAAVVAGGAGSPTPPDVAGIVLAGSLLALVVMTVKR